MADFLSSRKRSSTTCGTRKNWSIEPFHRLVREKQLIGYSYDGFWASMDTFKDRQQLEGLYSGGAAPWEVWKTNGNGLSASARLRTAECSCFR